MLKVAQSFRVEGAESAWFVLESDEDVKGPGVGTECTSVAIDESPGDVDMNVASTSAQENSGTGCCDA